MEKQVYFKNHLGEKLTGTLHQPEKPSDRGIIMLRRMVRDAIQAVADGAEPKGLHPRENAEGMVKLDSFVGVRTLQSERVAR